MSYERWTAWIEKAAALKNKYEQKKELVIKELASSRPGWFGKYKIRDAFVSLYLLHKITRTQRLLYVRFINGSGLFLSSIRDEAYRKHFEKINKKGKELLGLLEKEESILDTLSDEFAHIDREAGSRNANASEFLPPGEEVHLRSISKRLFPLIAVELQKRIKHAHKNILSNHKKERVLLDNIKSLAAGIYLNTKSLLISPSKTKSAATIIYFSTYTAFFLGLIEYPVFSTVTTMTRESIMS